jgi:hypothetical protein
LTAIRAGGPKRLAGFARAPARRVFPSLTDQSHADLHDGVMVMEEWIVAAATAEPFGLGLSFGLSRRGSNVLRSAAIAAAWTPGANGGGHVRWCYGCIVRYQRVRPLR